jgi:hypothetical protein
VPRLTHPTPSRRVRRPNPLRNLPALLPLDQCNVVLTLQIELELRAVAEIAAEPHRGVGGDRAPRVENVGDAAGRPADIERQPIGAELARLCPPYSSCVIARPAQGAKSEPRIFDDRISAIEIFSELNDRRRNSKPSRLRIVGGNAHQDNTRRGPSPANDEFAEILVVSQ